MSSSPPDPLLRFRPEFPILEKTAYLISSSLGATPRGAEQALAVVLSSFPYREPRNKIVVVEGDFPSSRYAIHGLAARRGFAVAAPAREERTGGTVAFDLPRDPHRGAMAKVAGEPAVVT